MVLPAPSLTVARGELEWADFTPVAFCQRPVFITELSNESLKQCSFVIN